MKGVKTLYICTECGYRSSKWLGKCPACGEWNCMEEHTETAQEKKTVSVNPVSVLINEDPAERI